jgi:hypothetical protein
LLFLCSCAFLEKAARHDFSEGRYVQVIPGSKPARVYATVNDDSITIYPLKKTEVGDEIDKTNTMVIHLGETNQVDEITRSTFRKTFVDFDLITILFKYRPEGESMPNQLNSNLNAAAYFGFRKDFYRVRPLRSPLEVSRNYLHHYSFDAGPFAGFGSVAMNPWVTDNHLTSEYDGFIFQKGVGAFFGINEVNFGILLGFDTLLDANRKYWIYQEKPWFGIAIGIANF